VLTNITPDHLDPEFGDRTEPIGIVGIGIDCLGEILPNLILIDVYAESEFDIPDVVATKVDMHNARNLVTFFSITIVMDTLD